MGDIVANDPRYPWRMPPSTPAPDAVSIEAVCTGNICRSPYLHVRLQAALDDIAAGDFIVTSSGIHAMVDWPAEPGTREVLSARGLSSEGLSARQTTEAILRRADLVLVMDPRHRAFVIDEFPGAAPRTFLVLELARLLTTLHAEHPWPARLASLAPTDVRGRWAAVTTAVHAARSPLGPGGSGDIVADPYRQQRPAFEAMAAQLDASIAPIVALEQAVRAQSR